MQLKDINVKCSNKITKDECLDPCIFGKKGKMYQDKDYWYLYLAGRNWNYFKTQLNFMEVWQDGDAEGVLRLNRPLTDKEAPKVRKAAELGKKRVMSEKQRDILQNHMFKTRCQLCFPDRTFVKTSTPLLP
jgi:hypothetical protein